MILWTEWSHLINDWYSPVDSSEIWLVLIDTTRINVWLNRFLEAERKKNRKTINATNKQTNKKKKRIVKWFQAEMKFVVLSSRADVQISQKLSSKICSSTEEKNWKFFSAVFHDTQISSNLTRWREKILCTDCIKVHILGKRQFVKVTLWTIVSSSCKKSGILDKKTVDWKRRPYSILL